MSLRRQTPSPYILSHKLHSLGAFYLSLTNLPKQIETMTSLHGDKAGIMLFAHYNIENWEAIKAITEQNRTESIDHFIKLLELCSHLY